MTGDDEDDSFRDAMEGVAPLAQKKVAHEKPRTTATPAQLERREAALGLKKPAVDPNYLTSGEVPMLHPRETLEWKKDGVQHGVQPPTPSSLPVAFPPLAAKVGHALANLMGTTAGLRGGLDPASWRIDRYAGRE